MSAGPRAGCEQMEPVRTVRHFDRMVSVMSYCIHRYGPTVQSMKTKNLILGAVASAGLTFAFSVPASESKSEAVDQKSLPAAVQATITEKAAGGEIVQVQREDDKDGRWNYEVVVKTNGKDWGFEVDPKGKFVKKHDDHTKTG